MTVDEIPNFDMIEPRHVELINYTVHPSFVSGNCTVAETVLVVRN
jgi:hypothetical protein